MNIFLYVEQWIKIQGWWKELIVGDRRSNGRKTEIVLLGDKNTTTVTVVKVLFHSLY